MCPNILTCYLLRCNYKNEVISTMVVLISYRCGWVGSSDKLITKHVQNGLIMCEYAHLLDMCLECASIKVMNAENSGHNEVRLKYILFRCM